ncbi:MAG: Aminopeptidase, partial [Frankiales bacterium]|nr:Aminopeptidase [Frankiales bacterium]
MGSGDPAQGVGHPLSSTPAVVLGGTSLLGSCRRSRGTTFLRPTQIGTSQAPCHPGWTIRTTRPAAVRTTERAPAARPARGDLPGRGPRGVGRGKVAEGWPTSLTSQVIGVDVVEPPVLFALQALGAPVVGEQQVFLEARRITTPDET